MPQHDAFFDTLEMDLQLQQRVQDEQLEEELLERVHTPQIRRYKRVW